MNYSEELKQDSVLRVPDTSDLNQVKGVSNISAHIDALRRVVGFLEDRVDHTKSQADHMVGPVPPSNEDPTAPPAASVIEQLAYLERRVFALIAQLAREQHRLEQALGREGFQATGVGQGRG